MESLAHPISSIDDPLELVHIKSQGKVITLREYLGTVDPQRKPYELGYELGKVSSYIYKRYKFKFKKLVYEDISFGDFRLANINIQTEVFTF